MTTNRENLPNLQPVPLGPQLPQELVDQVIDHLNDDLDALKQCSLVSKAWAPSCTLHLFSELRFPPYCHWPNTFREQPCALHNRGVNWTELIELLSSSPRIRNAVRKLRLTGWRNIASAGRRLPQRVGRPALPGRTLLTILDALPHLRVLELNQCFLDEETLSSPPSAAYSRSLDELILDPVIYPDPLHLNAFLLLFSRIDCLVLHLEPVYGWQWISMPSGLIPRCSTTVGSLTLACASFFELAMMTNALQKVVAVPLQSVTFQSFPSSLGELDSPTSAAGAMIPAAFGGPCPLPDCSDLRSARVTCWLYCKQGMPEPVSFLQWAYMMRDIRLLAQPCLESLAIDICVVSGYAAPIDVNDIGNALLSFLQRADWAVLVAATAGQNRSIQNLQIRLRFVPSLDEVEPTALIDICRETTTQQLGRHVTNILDVRTVAVPVE